MLDQTAYSTSEDEGSVEICASVVEPSTLSGSVTASLSAMPGTADGEWLGHSEAEPASQCSMHSCEGLRGVMLVV